jgi:hypothetical protein
LGLVGYKIRVAGRFAETDEVVPLVGIMVGLELKVIEK